MCPQPSVQKKSERSQNPGASRVRWFLRAWGLWGEEAAQSDICPEPQSQATVPPGISRTTGVHASRVTSERMNSERPGCRPWAGSRLGKEGAVCSGVPVARCGSRKGGWRSAACTPDAMWGAESEMLAPRGITERLRDPQASTPKSADMQS